VVSHDAPHHGPGVADAYTTIVHSARADDVRLTAVAGRVLYRDGGHLTLDAARLVAEARAEALALVRRRAQGLAA